MELERGWKARRDAAATRRKRQDILSGLRAERAALYAAQITTTEETVEAAPAPVVEAPAPAKAAKSK